METNKDDKERSEPIRDIIERMPTHFGTVITCLVIRGLVLLLCTLASFIRVSGVR